MKVSADDGFMMHWSECHESNELSHSNYSRYLIYLEGFSNAFQSSLVGVFRSIFIILQS